MATDSKSSKKYNDAVNGARASEEAKSGEESSGQALMPKGADVMILKPSEADIAQLMNDDSMEFAPQVRSLEEGDLIVGVLEGRGPSVDFTQMDGFTKQEVTRTVDTWIIRSPAGNLRMSILSSVQLDKKLPPFIGGMVKIFRGKDVKTGKGFRVTDYLVAGPKLPDGKLRSFTVAPSIDAESRTIDGPQAAPQLPAGSAQVAGGEDARA